MDPLSYLLVWALLLSPIYATCAVVVWGVVKAVNKIADRSFIDSVATVLASPVTSHALETAVEMADRWLSRSF